MQYKDNRVPLYLVFSKRNAFSQIPSNRFSLSSPSHIFNIREGGRKNLLLPVTYEKQLPPAPPPRHSSAAAILAEQYGCELSMGLSHAVTLQVPFQGQKRFYASFNAWIGGWKTLFSKSHPFHCHTF